MQCLHWATDVAASDMVSFYFFSYLLRNQGSKREEGESQRTWGYWSKQYCVKFT